MTYNVFGGTLNLTRLLPHTGQWFLICTRMSSTLDRWSMKAHPECIITVLVIFVKISVWQVKLMQKCVIIYQYVQHILHFSRFIVCVK